MNIGELKQAISKYDDDQYVSVLKLENWSQEAWTQNIIEKVVAYKPWHPGVKNLVGLALYAGEGKSYQEKIGDDVQDSVTKSAVQS